MSGVEATRRENAAVGVDVGNNRAALGAKVARGRPGTDHGPRGVLHQVAHRAGRHRQPVVDEGVGHVVGLARHRRQRVGVDRGGNGNKTGFVGGLEDRRLDGSVGPGQQRAGPVAQPEARAGQGAAGGLLDGGRAGRGDIGPGGNEHGRLGRSGRARRGILGGILGGGRFSADGGRFRQTVWIAHGTPPFGPMGYDGAIDIGHSFP